MRKTTIRCCLALLVIVPGLALAHGYGHVMGTIQRVHPDRLDIVTKDGKALSIPLTKSTRYFRGDRSATAAALETGSRVVVHLAADGSALEVRLPSETAAPSKKKPR
jgi:hypothetical protein